jgi:signal transduction histidine kinase
MTLRKNKRSLEEAQVQLEERNQELELFAQRAAHDIKSPLNNISQLSQIFTETYASVIDPEGLQILDFIEQSSNTLKDLVDGILSFSRSHSSLNSTKSTFKSDAILGGLKGSLINDPTYTISLSSETKELYMNRAALEIILLNLIANAIKYSDKEITKVTIDITEEDSRYLFAVHDNGRGIEAENQSKIFNLFETLGEDDKFGEKGTGIGLATVKKLVVAMGGDISVKSENMEGCTFIFSIQK